MEGKSGFEIVKVSSTSVYLKLIFDWRFFVGNPSGTVHDYKVMFPVYTLQAASSSSLLKKPIHVSAITPFLLAVSRTALPASLVPAPKLKITSFVEGK